MTERTYKKDIEVIADHFHRELLLLIHPQNEIHLNPEGDTSPNPEHEALLNLSEVLFTNLVPIYNFHLQFLRQLEQRISIWYGAGEKGINLFILLFLFPGKLDRYLAMNV